jgi:hypothetical protein
VIAEKQAQHGSPAYMMKNSVIALRASCIQLNILGDLVLIADM